MAFKMGPLHAKRRALLDQLAARILTRPHPGRFDPSKVRKVVFLRDNNKLGDLIVSTVAIRELKRAGMQVDIITREAVAGLLACNPYVDRIYQHGDSIGTVAKLARSLRGAGYDLLIDQRNEKPTYKDLLLLRLLGAKHILGFNKAAYPIYDCNIDENFSLKRHAVMRNLDILQALDLPVEQVDLTYDAPMGETAEQQVQAWLASLPAAANLVINVKGDSPYRSLTSGQLASIVEWMQCHAPGFNLILTGKPADIADINLNGVLKSPFADYLSALALVKHADVLISPDTSIVHAASAYQRPIVTLYQIDDPATGIYSNAAAWGPNNPHATQIISDTRSVADIPVARIIADLATLVSRTNAGQVDV
ncbi:hypothetical protein KSF73_03390 [Burkholderiaceae bacterium DAT-1]|nr:hypothetical protein [Burkholderiaceae bacterium DAT-1]